MAKQQEYKQGYENLSTSDDVHGEDYGFAFRLPQADGSKAYHASGTSGGAGTSSGAYPASAFPASAYPAAAYAGSGAPVTGYPVMGGPAGMVAHDPLDMGRRERKHARRQARRNARGANGANVANGGAPRRRRPPLLVLVNPVIHAHMLMGLARRAFHAAQGQKKKLPQSQQQQKPPANAHHAGPSYQ